MSIYPQDSNFHTTSIRMSDIYSVAETDKIKIKKKKKRIPLPKKPPKVEKDKKAYNRKKDREKLRREFKKE